PEDPVPSSPSGYLLQICCAESTQRLCHWFITTSPPRAGRRRLLMRTGASSGADGPMPRPSAAFCVPWTLRGRGGRAGSRARMQADLASFQGRLRCFAEVLQGRSRIFERAGFEADPDVPAAPLGGVQGEIREVDDLFPGDRARLAGRGRIDREADRAGPPYHGPVVEPEVVRFERGAELFREDRRVAAVDETGDHQELLPA